MEPLKIKLAETTPAIVNMEDSLKRLMEIWDMIGKQNLLPYILPSITSHEGPFNVFFCTHTDGTAEVRNNGKGLMIKICYNNTEILAELRHGDFDSLVFPEIWIYCKSDLKETYRVLNNSHSLYIIPTFYSSYSSINKEHEHSSKHIFS